MKTAFYTKYMKSKYEEKIKIVSLLLQITVLVIYFWFAKEPFRWPPYLQCLGEDVDEDSEGKDNHQDGEQGQLKDGEPRLSQTDLECRIVNIGASYLVWWEGIKIDIFRKEKSLKCQGSYILLRKQVFPVLCQKFSFALKIFLQISFFVPRPN